MSDIFEQMIAQHTIAGDNDRKNALYEVMQQVVLSGLYRGGFFKEAAFYGGTCLRIFHGLRRYSEDMDFSLLAKNPDFTLEPYFPAIIEEARILGRTVTITKKDKRTFGKVESAFLKDNTDVYNLTFQTEKALKIKIEVDVNPPLEFSTEQKLLMQPFSFTTRCFTLPDLYAGKMHALTFRAWKNRIKGRDWYDFEWYVRNRVTLDFEHLKVRTKEFNDIDLTKELFLELLKERISKADIDVVKADVIPYIIDKRELDIWSNDYFLQLADMIVFK
ncbi:nucleotidyl transferase AbiEii/AbiGii toxin family protein [Prevotella communis]|uniref:nucleotidyl transferase AbiEii/AbiGii toxin family protein n=1 Tax=Prevotella communis TaxID=2913614 RepID=UPI001EDA32F7|nr:nucleotidyl transferase AbiEii/AbiGii toxin family protein [Prevotella communis]UKK58111.1 nucleotidyl transferase AbiEii/AbiGii toxin family protein [Prevotella communis]UKK60789.1 nucleotidyl transferase AbiEii/AbiGii toxin family protein [Prevotella communis]UKK63615.1 nucleotidyl transferase AbiEii/AbiGii toxin family protein [Prevotella communis]